MADHIEPTYYDFEDEAENVAHYGQTRPPQYNVSAIRSEHIAVIYAHNDWINHQDNVKLLKQNLKGE